MLEVSFIGRRSVFNELSSIVTGPISVKYADSRVIRAVGNEVCILDYYVDVDCSGNCVRVGRYVEPVELMGILTSIIVNMLNHELIKMGIDYGTERTGVVLIYDNTPLIGSILTPVKLIKLIKLINGRFSEVAIGDSPSARRFLGRSINDLCSITDNILIINELESSRLRNWISTNGLMGDVADAYAIALTKPKITIKCPNLKD
ncbi:hypothetical protein [Caldivirga maquilingensis]|uniref:Uncharacterized protein n=1 Tax=Caldivirga maquilingensis (strain ATCC 700844 / DSM 13496 / JCM 10307 / IC-167) TaxID=397948 RepID=A8MCM0_CALMQ|nr:hypothetical protein [Caldivirga maquilingensis]ABW01526.1 hypothetical protein Cmaq_0686 [Caldivirga maquilingensis IC-167]